MSRKIIELVQVLIDRIEKNGYQQRAREDDIADVYKRLTDAEGQAKHWRQARQEAHEAGELMRAEIETLRQQLADAQRAVSDAFAEVNSVRQQLDAANTAVTLQRAGIERLQAFVGKVRACVWACYEWPQSWHKIEAALVELDAGTEPTPVAEPLDVESNTCPGK